jgi:hypothetical protein
VHRGYDGSDSSYGRGMERPLNVNAILISTKDGLDDQQPSRIPRPVPSVIEFLMETLSVVVSDKNFVDSWPPCPLTTEVPSSIVSPHARFQDCLLKPSSPVATNSQAHGVGRCTNRASPVDVRFLFWLALCSSGVSNFSTRLDFKPKLLQLVLLLL